MPPTFGIAAGTMDLIPSALELCTAHKGLFTLRAYPRVPVTLRKHKSSSLKTTTPFTLTSVRPATLRSPCERLLNRSNNDEFHGLCVGL